MQYSETESINRVGQKPIVSFLEACFPWKLFVVIVPSVGVLRCLLPEYNGDLLGP